MDRTEMNYKICLIRYIYIFDRLWLETRLYDGRELELCSVFET